MNFRSVVAVAVAVSMAGCAVTKPQFQARRSGMTDAEVCAVRNQAREAKDNELLLAAIEESERRGLTVEQCIAYGKASSDSLTKGLLMVGAVVASVALIGAARKGGGGSAPLYVPPAPSDTDWAWDEFFNEYRQLVWACRGVQTGQFADPSRCAYKMKLDATWPRKEAP